MLFDGWESVLRVVVGAAIVYVLVIGALRLIGSRALAKMSAYDLIVTVALGSRVAAIPITGGVTVADGIAAIVTFLGLQELTRWFQARSTRFHHLVRERPYVLVWDGRFQRAELESLSVTEDEVRAAIRRAGIASVAAVQAVVLENDGEWSVLPRTPDAHDFSALHGLAVPGKSPAQVERENASSLTRGLTTGLTALALAGCASLSRPAYRGPRSDHFDGQRFHNYVRFRDRQIDDAIRRELNILLRRRGRWARWEATPTDTPPARVTGDSLRVTFVNHATLLIQTAGLNVLTDPVWSERVSPVRWAGPKRHRPPGIRFDDLPPIDLVIVSHDHYDHMDVPTLRRLAARFHPRIVTGLGGAAYLAARGVTGAEDLDWWQSTPVGTGVRLVGVPAQHWSARTLADKWRRLWLGFVLDAPGGPVYFAGDTGFGAFLPAIRERLGAPRLALLPISPARPRAAMAPRHLSAGEAVNAARLLGASTSIAMHFGTFQQGDDGQQEPVDSLRAALAAPDAPRFRVLGNGEWTLVPR